MQARAIQSNPGYRDAQEENHRNKKAREVSPTQSRVIIVEGLLQGEFQEKGAFFYME